MNNIGEYCLIKFHKRTGKIDTTLEAEGYDQLIKWAMKATPQTKESIIFNKATGKIVCYISGTPNGGELITIDYDTNIEELCPGILSAVNS